MTTAEAVPFSTISVRQREVLTFIGLHQRVTGQAPTYREIATHLGVASTNAVNDLIVRLRRDGWIKRPPIAPVDEHFVDARFGVRGQRTAPFQLTDAAMTLVFGPPCKRCGGTGRRR